MDLEVMTPNEGSRSQVTPRWQALAPGDSSAASAHAGQAGFDERGCSRGPIACGTFMSPQLASGVRLAPGGPPSAAGGRPAADRVDTRPDLLAGGLRQRGSPAGTAQVRMYHRVRLAGPVMPGRNQQVQLLAQRAERLAGRGRPGSG